MAKVVASQLNIACLLPLALIDKVNGRFGSLSSAFSIDQTAFVTLE
jgi:hypothetical protein